MPTTIEGIKFYKVNEVAETLLVSPQTVRTYINKGRIKAVRIGRYIYVTEKDLLKFLTPAK